MARDFVTPQNSWTSWSYTDQNVLVIWASYHHHQTKVLVIKTTKQTFLKLNFLFGTARMNKTESHTSNSKYTVRRQNWQSAHVEGRNLPNISNDPSPPSSAKPQSLFDLRATKVLLCFFLCVTRCVNILHSQLWHHQAGRGMFTLFVTNRSSGMHGEKI